MDSNESMISLFLILTLCQAFQGVYCDFVVLDNEDKFISAGFFHTCAIESRPGIEIGGGIKCWGDNSKGQISSPPGIHRQISCGKFFSCAITVEDKINCWGAMVGRVPEGKFSQVSVGETHACALERSGKIKCWGRNDFGESKPPDHHYTQVSSGLANSCGIRLNGSVECWGRNQFDQSKPPDNKFMQISVGSEDHACGITLDGDVKCWGSNSRGQSRFSSGPFIQVSSGIQSTCAIHSNHTIDCWGQSRRPVPIGSFSNSTTYQHVTLGMDHACALSDDRKVQCWNSGPDVGAHIIPLGFVAAKR